jgi:hypothetical protein
MIAHTLPFLVTAAYPFPPGGWLVSDPNYQHLYLLRVDGTTSLIGPGFLCSNWEKDKIQFAHRTQGQSPWYITPAGTLTNEADEAAVSDFSSSFEYQFLPLAGHPVINRLLHVQNDVVLAIWNKETGDTVCLALPEAYRPKEGMAAPFMVPAADHLTFLVFLKTDYRHGSNQVLIIDNPF